MTNGQSGHQGTYWENKVREELSSPEQHKCCEGTTMSPLPRTQRAGKPRWLTSSTLAPLWFLTKASFICFGDICFFFLPYSHWAPLRRPAEGHGRATGLPPRPQGTTRASCLLATPYWRVLVCFQFFTLMDTPYLSTLLVIKVVPNFFLDNKTLWNKNPGACVLVHNWRTLDKFLEVELLGQRTYTFRILELMPK